MEKLPLDQIEQGSACNRRHFLATSISGLGAVAALGTASKLMAQEEKNEPKAIEEPEEEETEEVAPAEDLMREHGVLNRILLIYDESIRRFAQPNPDVPLDVIAASAGIVRHFIEDYHEKLEENYLFPRFRKAGKQVELVNVLLAQHQAGRVLTDKIVKFAKPEEITDVDTRNQLVSAMESFNRMYRPHEAREDTVLFPAFKEIVSPHEYAALGEDFEEKEYQLFGEDGFEKMIDKVAGLEKKMGIYDLAKFTPKI